MSVDLVQLGWQLVALAAISAGVATFWRSSVSASRVRVLQDALRSLRSEIRDEIRARDTETLQVADSRAAERIAPLADRIVAAAHSASKLDDVAARLSKLEMRLNLGRTG